MTCGPHVIFSLLPLFSDHPLFSPAPPRLPLAASPSAVPQRCCRPHHPPLSSTSAGGLAPRPRHLPLPVGCLFLLLPLAADVRLCGSAEVVVVAWDVASSSPSKPAPASDMTRYADPPILTCRCRSSASFCILGSPLVFFLEIPFSYIAAFRSEFPLAFCADSSTQISEWPV